MQDIPQVGQLVELNVLTLNGAVTHRGIVLPPSMKQHITLKLENGYNVNYPVDAITSWQGLELTSANEIQTQASTITMNEDLPRVRLIHTGGTIASKVDYSTGAVNARFEPEELLEAIPELATIAHLDAIKLGNMFSDDIRPQHWNSMIDACQAAFEDGCKGVVITHGTDTLHISASAIGFAFAAQGGAPSGPIVFVGSQRSSDRGSSDATENLLAAVYWAANAPPPLGSAGDSSVVMMHATQDDGTIAAHSAFAVRKLHSSRRDAFQSVNGHPLGWVRTVGREQSMDLHPNYATLQEHHEETQPLPPTHFMPDQRIGQFMAGPWLRSEEIEAVLASGCQAIVIHGTGLGHVPIEDTQGDAPENTELWKAFMRCKNRDIPVLVVNQCIHGPVDMHVYSKGRKQLELGFLGHGMHSSPETMVVKLHWALSNSAQLADTMASNLCGEHRENLYE